MIHLSHPSFGETDKTKNFLLCGGKITLEKSQILFNVLHKPESNSSLVSSPVYFAKTSNHMKRAHDNTIFRKSKLS